MNYNSLKVSKILILDIDVC